jgi:hypothetical protein
MHSLVDEVEEEVEEETFYVPSFTNTEATLPGTPNDHPLDQKILTDADNYQHSITSEGKLSVWNNEHQQYLSLLEII